MNILGKTMANANCKKILKALGLSMAGGRWEAVRNIELNLSEVSKRSGLPNSSVGKLVPAMEEAGLVCTREDFPSKFVSLSPDAEELLSDWKRAVDSWKLQKLKSSKNISEITNFLSGNPDTRVSDICPGMNRSLLSQELARMRTAGLVKFRQNGRERRYWLAQQ